jgi:uncharacterized protein (TIGR02996 family)
MSHDAFVKTIRANPDDDTARLVFADWYEENGQPERAAYIRASCRLARLPTTDPEYREVQQRCLELYTAHHAAWAGDWPANLEWSFERGLITGVTGAPAVLAEHWQAIFAQHPVHRVRLADTNPVESKQAARQLGWLPFVDDLRLYWRDPEHTFFDHFDPGALRLRRLWLDGDPNPEEVLKLLDGPTRTTLESFRYIYCRYSYGGGEGGRWEQQMTAFHRMLERLDDAPLRELGLLPGGLSFEPSDLEKISARAFAPRLEYLELSAAEPTKGAADLLATTDRLPGLRRLALGIDRANRLHSLGSILNNPHLANLTSLATEWSAASDRTIRTSAFGARATELQLWRPISARRPRAGVPLNHAGIAPPCLDMSADDIATAAADGWAKTRWAAEVRELRLRGYASSMLQFATKLVRTAGFPALHTLSLVIDGTITARELEEFVTAARRAEWLHDVLVTCYANSVPGAERDRLEGVIPAANPENPGDLAWYACPPAVGQRRAFHILAG